MEELIVRYLIQVGGPAAALGLPVILWLRYSRSAPASVSERLEKRFDEQGAAIKRRFDEQDATLKRRLDEQDQTIERRFDAQDAAIERHVSLVVRRFSPQGAADDDESRPSA